MKPVRLLILGTGWMAGTHARAFAAIPGVKTVAAVDTRLAQLTEFCDTHRIEKRFTSLEEALAWGQFDAVTNVTPDAAHYPTTMPLLKAGKHVLCEKPLAANVSDANEMAAAAKAAGVINMVNLSYRNVPAACRAAQMVAEGAIGRVRHFEASYLQSWLVQPAWGDWRTEKQWLWRLSKEHGSRGVLGDVGIHILDFTTFIAGEAVSDLSCRLATFDKAPGDRIGEYPLDANDTATMQLQLAGGAVGTLAATRFAAGHLNDLRLRIYGDRGALEVTFERMRGRLRACLPPDLEEARWQRLPCPAVPTLYQRFIRAIRSGVNDGPDFARGAELQALLDRAEETAIVSGSSPLP